MAYFHEFNRLFKKFYFFGTFQIQNLCKFKFFFFCIGGNHRRLKYFFFVFEARSVNKMVFVSCECRASQENERIKVKLKSAKKRGTSAAVSNTSARW